ncbi:MAG: MBOAT family protein [Acidaminococcaceae bacterium]|nr:MBOAT family protein [Acidaminococcaceae bacterium]
MTFTSPVFLFVFLPVILAAHFLIRKEFRNLLLFLASSVFYFYGEQKMLALMYFVIFINWLTALGIDYLKNNTNRFKPIYMKIITVGCIAICIGLLWYFKYWNFTLHLFNDIANILDISYRITKFDKIILPLGISFYTFHVLSYTLDVYMGKMKADKNLLNFATYVLMFPQLVAGPIVRYIDIQKQFIERTITPLGAANGFRRFCFGMGKKILIANTVAKAADKIFALNAAQIDMATAWLGAVCYTLQIYFDFSGYSDMAIGLAMMFGFHYKENFNYPYISKTVGEFWRRWHISLSTWLRDYVYINMGGNRVSVFRFCANTLFVFLLSGLWHGANLTFVLWGIWYGIFIILEKLFLKNFLADKKWLAHFYALLVIVFGWVMFRSDTVTYALKYWIAMIGINGIDIDKALSFTQNDIYAAITLGTFFSFDWRSLYKKFVVGTKTSHTRFFVFKIISYVTAVFIFILSLTSIMSSTYNPFIYFRF